jgi:hypothetical protein
MIAACFPMRNKLLRRISTFWGSRGKDMLGKKCARSPGCCCSRRTTRRVRSRAPPPLRSMSPWPRRAGWQLGGPTSTCRQRWGRRALRTRFYGFLRAVLLYVLLLGVDVATHAQVLHLIDLGEVELLFAAAYSSWMRLCSFLVFGIFLYRGRPA